MRGNLIRGKALGIRLSMPCLASAFLRTFQLKIDLYWIFLVVVVGVLPDDLKKKKHTNLDTSIPSFPTVDHGKCQYAQSSKY